jgi:hypothetical protein
MERLERISGVVFPLILRLAAPVPQRAATSDIPDRIAQSSGLAKELYQKIGDRGEAAMPALRALTRIE